MADKLLAYNEPHISGGNCEVTMTEIQAIKWTQQIHPELNKKEALQDFIVIHWAHYKY